MACKSLSTSAGVVNIYGRTDVARSTLPKRLACVFAAETLFFFCCLAQFMHPRVRQYRRLETGVTDRRTQNRGRMPAGTALGTHPIHVRSHRRHFHCAGSTSRHAKQCAHPGVHPRTAKRSLPTWSRHLAAAKADSQTIAPITAVLLSCTALCTPRLACITRRHRSLARRPRTDPRSSTETRKNRDRHPPLRIGFARALHPPASQLFLRALSASGGHHRSHRRRRNHLADIFVNGWTFRASMSRHFNSPLPSARA